MCGFTPEAAAKEDKLCLAKGDGSPPATEMEKVPNKKCLELGSPPQVERLLSPSAEPIPGFLISVSPQVILSH